MMRIPAKTRPNPASTRCSIDHRARRAGNHPAGKIGVVGEAGTGSDRAGGAVGVGAECSCVAESMAQEQVEQSSSVITLETLLWPLRPCKQYLRRPSCVS